MRVVGEEPRRHRIDRHLLAGRLPRIQHADEVAVVAAPPEAILGVGDAAPHAATVPARAARLCRDVVVRHPSRRPLDAPDVAAVPRRAVQIVLRVGGDVVGDERTLPLERGVLPRLEVDAIGGAPFRPPPVAIHVRRRDVDHLAAAGGIDERERFRRRVEDHESALRLIADVEAALVVRPHHRAGPGRRERAFPAAIRPAPQLRLPGLRVQPADGVVVEVVEVDQPVLADARVMRAAGRGQPPGGVDDAGLCALRARQRLQLVLPHAAAQVDPGHRLGLLPVQRRRLAPFGAAPCSRLRPGQLERHRRAARRVDHPLHHPGELLGGVARERRPLQRVAAAAVAEQRPLRLVVERVAGEPFGIGKLQGEFEHVGRAQVEVEPCGTCRRHVQRRGRHDVAARANRDLVAARLQAPLRKGIRAVGAAHDGRRNGAAGAPGGDEHAFHAAFALGSHLSGERRGVLLGCARVHGWPHRDDEQRRGGREEEGCPESHECVLVAGGRLEQPLRREPSGSIPQRLRAQCPAAM